MGKMVKDFGEGNVVDFSKIWGKSEIAFFRLKRMEETKELTKNGKKLAELIDEPEVIADLLNFLDDLFEPDGSVLIEKKKYKYYLLERPPMPGAFPNEKSNPPIEIIAFDEKRRIDEQEISVWGYVSYEKPLSLQEIEDYELAEEL